MRFRSGTVWLMRRFGTERRLLNLTPSQLKLNSFATRISRQRCSSVMVSPILRPLSLLLSRNSAALTSSCNRTITQAVWTRPTLRDYGLKRLSHGSSVVLQELQSGDSEAAGTSQGLALTDSCVEVHGVIAWIQELGREYAHRFL